MKKEELMHGDLLMYYGHLCRFIIRSDGAIIERSDDKNEYLPCSCESDKAEPIPLTERILKANGWWNDEDMNDETTRFMFYRYKDYVITFVSHSGLSVLTIEQDNQSDFRTVIQLVDEVYNVHELQHALRLCGLHELAENFKIE